MREVPSVSAELEIKGAGAPVPPTPGSNGFK